MSFLDALRSLAGWVRKDAARVHESHIRINALRIDQAESEARELLTLPTPFQTIREALLGRDRSRLDGLPAEVAAFFSAYSEVSGKGMRLARSEIGPFEPDPAFTRIGSDIENAPVIVRKTDGRVFVVEEGQATRYLDDPYQSVWHYVLEVASHE
jgi:hypothetical protein